MSKEDVIELEGVVSQQCGNGFYRVNIDMGDGQCHEIMSKACGKMRMHVIRILVGDRVRVECSTYDTTKGRITYRFKGCEK